MEIKSIVEALEPDLVWPPPPPTPAFFFFGGDRVSYMALVILELTM